MSSQSYKYTVQPSCSIFLTYTSNGKLQDKGRYNFQCFQSFNIMHRVRINSMLQTSVAKRMSTRGTRRSALTGGTRAKS